MKRINLSFLVVALFSASIFAYGDVSSKGSKKSIVAAPASPVFSTSERHAELAARRKRVGDMMEDNSIMILMSAESKLYTNDVDYVYRQENNLFYLTELKQNGITLVLSKNGGALTETLFLAKRSPQRETWNGKMYSNEDATSISGIGNIVDSKEVKGFLEAVKGGQSAAGIAVPSSIYLLSGSKREFKDENDFAAELPKSKVRNGLPIFAKLRLIKSPYEIRLMQHAIDITSEALMRSMGMIGMAKWEYEVHAEVEYTFRRRNADSWGYPSIVGCGPNATTLHYVDSQGNVNSGDLMLMDVGAEYAHYTADVTRTFPVNGKFTKEQAEIYKIVYDAQEAAAAQLKPGAKIADAGQAAAQVIKDGLFELGLITDKDSNQYRLWYMHGWGHWLGMNVHDVGNYNATLSEGMMMTNEPGIYFRENALEFLPDTAEWNEYKKKVGPVFEKYKNIGVRIEDDMLITKDGAEWMTKDLPREMNDVENFMKVAAKEMKKRYAFNPVPSSSFSDSIASYDPTVNYLIESGNTYRAAYVGKGKTRMIHSH